MEDLSAWIGRTEARADVASAGVVDRLRALLDHQSAPCRSGDPLPPLAHWLHFLPDARQSELGEDGHPRTGGFLPPAAQPRRMWAGGQVRFIAPIAVGAEMTRTTTIVSIDEKARRSGALVFVKLLHRIEAEGQIRIEEEQDLVYRDPVTTVDGPAKGSTPPPDEKAAVRRIVPDPSLCFRYSALTFNAHRIHYDLPYTREIEGYRGLVIQGPLLATLLADHAARQYNAAKMAAFEFQAKRPSFVGETIELRVDSEHEGVLDLSARGPDGSINVFARATFDVSDCAPA